VPDPVATVLGSRLYDTGDRALYERCDGVLTYVGRRDSQLKIRGVRVEPGEIEAHLATHPDVHHVAVIAVAYEQVAAQRLVAYVVPRSGCRPTPETLRRHLAERVIEPMIPGVFVFLDALPLTASGKLDRGALPAVTADPQQAPRDSTLSPLEESVAAIWRRVLRVTNVGADDNFFDKGGHSLFVLEVRNAIQEELGVALTVVDLFTYPTVRTLAGRLAPEPSAATGAAARARGARRRQAASEQDAVVESRV